MEWVKLSERKPPRDANYLVHWPSADPDKALVTTAWYHPREGWSLIPHAWIKGITHWMELPEPPKPETD